jgi:hypothetical protein
MKFHQILPNSAKFLKISRCRENGKQAFFVSTLLGRYYIRAQKRRGSPPRGFDQFIRIREGGMMEVRIMMGGKLIRENINYVHRRIIKESFKKEGYYRER